MRRLRTLYLCKSGSVGVIFAATIAPLALGICAAIEMSQAHIVREQLSLALAAVANAWRAEPDRENAEALATDIFDLYRDAFPLRVVASLTVHENDGEAIMTATAFMETRFLEVFGIPGLEIAVEQNAKRPSTSTSSNAPMP